MKVVALVRALFRVRTTIKSHNDNLRAGQFPEQTAFSPWRALVS